MPATTYDFTGANRMEAGATFDVIIPFVDANGDPLDLTDFDPNLSGDGGRMMLREAVDDPDAVGPPASPILSLTAQLFPLVEGVYIVQPATLGQVRIYIEAATLAALSFTLGAPIPTNRVGVHDLEVDDGGAKPKVWRLIQGAFAIDPEVTR